MHDANKERNLAAGEPDPAVLPLMSRAVARDIALINLLGSGDGQHH